LTALVTALLLLLTSTTALGVASGPANAKPRKPAAPVITPKMPITGQKVTATGKLPTKTKRPITLQVKTGKKWQPTTRGKTNAKGGYTLRFTASRKSGDYSYRAVAKKTRTARKTLPALTTKARGITVTRPMPASQRQALIDLYNATNGPTWRRNNGWNTATNPCAWYGIVCRSFGPVTDLWLPSNKLTGTLPDSLGSLTNLTTLRLERNKLTGSIPASLGNLTRLQDLDLGLNQLTGPIPDSLANLTRLESLDLGINQLTGPIPDSLANLTHLEHLDLESNWLTGPVPASIRNLTNLQTLTLFGNGCLNSGGDTALAAWLDNLDPDWDDGCG
jgi:hypothetical protein